MTSKVASATPPVAWARLLFTPERARRVAQQLSHPDQESHVHPDGSYELLIPYVDDRELLDDILRFGPDVEVLAPAHLRLKVHQRLLAAAGRYLRGAGTGIFP